jgi:uncharacterized protein YdcH (DUF465 family)
LKETKDEILKLKQRRVALKDELKGKTEMNAELNEKIKSLE